MCGCSNQTIVLTVMTRSILLFILILAHVRSVASSGNVNLDMAIIAHDGAQFYAEIGGPVKNFITTILPTVFTIADDKTRLAFVVCKGGDFSETGAKYGSWVVEQGLTGDVKLFKGKVDGRLQYRELADVDPYDAFNLVRTNVFQGNKTRPRVVLVISQALHTGVSARSIKLALEMQKQDGVLFLSIMNPVGETGIEDAKDQHLSMVGDDPENLWAVEFPGDLVENRGSALLLKVKNRINQRLCLYVMKCFFVDDKGTCRQSGYTDKLPLVLGDCDGSGSLKPPDGPICERHQCEQTCNDLWSFPANASSGCNDDTCGQELNNSVPRIGSYQWTVLQYCPARFRCSPCPTEGPEETDGPEETPVDVGGVEEPEESSSISLGLTLGITIPIVVIILCLAGAGVGFFLMKHRGGMGARVGKKKLGDVEAAAMEGEESGSDEEDSDEVITPVKSKSKAKSVSKPKATSKSKAKAKSKSKSKLKSKAKSKSKPKAGSKAPKKKKKKKGKK